MKTASRLPLLFARYVSGQISDRTWQAFTDAIDSLDLAADERRAFTAFFSDAIDEIGADAIRLPAHKEAASVMQSMHPVP